MGFSLYPQIFFDLFRVIRVERGRNWGTRARTFDPSIFHGYISAYSDCYEKPESYSSLFSNSFASIALNWAISSLWRTRSLMLLARPSCADMNRGRSILKLYNALFALFWRQLEPAFYLHIHEAFQNDISTRPLDSDSPAPQGLLLWSLVIFDREI